MASVVLILRVAVRGAEDRVARRLRVVGERLVPRPREAERRARDGHIMKCRGADLARDDRAAGREDVVVRERVEDAVDRRPRRLGVGVAVEEADGGERCQDQLFCERGLRVRGDEGRRAGDEDRSQFSDPVRRGPLGAVGLAEVDADVAAACVEIKILRRVRAERHRRDACSGK